jgi:LacI family transcriptional regulator
MSVSADHYDIAYHMTTRLVELGHRCIGFIAGPPTSKGGAERLRGHLNATCEAKLTFSPIEQGLHTFHSGLHAAERLLSASPACTAVVACNDEMAAAAIFVAHQRGLAVPQDITVVGFDDTPIASIIYPTITTARQPIAEMARAAIQLLHNATVLGARSSGPLQKVLRYSLIERQSSAGPRQHDLPG